MDGDPTPQTPVTEAATAAAPTAAEASASPAPDAAAPTTTPFSLNDAIRGMAAGRGPALNLGGVVPTAELTTDEDDNPASAEDVTSGSAPAPGTGGGRRSKRAQADAERIAELERQVAAASPEHLRQQIAAEDAQRAQQAALDAQAEADATRFQRLNQTPDAELSGEDYAWREEQKELLAKYPRVRELADGIVKAERESLRQDSSRRETKFWDDVRTQLSVAATLPNTNPKDLEAGTPNAPKTFPEMAHYYHAAGAAWKEAEYAPQLAEAQATIARQAADIADLRLHGPQGLAHAAAPFSGGTSGGQPPSTFDFNAHIRRAVGAQ